MMKDKNEKLIEAKTLANGIKVSLFDHSKVMAADRWYIKILCRMELAMPMEKLALCGLDDTGRQDFCERCQGVLVHEFTKERNFIDARDKDDAVAAIISQIHENSLSYVVSPVFADNLFTQKVAEFVKEQEVRRQMALVAEEHDDDGPADFSACFKD